MIPLPGTHPHFYAIAFAAIVVLLVARRIPGLRTLISLASWVAILILMVVAVGQRQTFDPYVARALQFLHLEDQRVEGGETRIRMSPDGHFWVRVKLGRTEQRMLVDSGATVTALSSRTAAEMGLDPRPGIVPVLLTTANGTIRAQTVTVPELRLGSIVARDLSAVVSPAFGNVNVVGMNFLSRLKSWRVEDNMLILVPHHPQESAS